MSDILPVSKQDFLLSSKSEVRAAQEVIENNY